MGHDAKAWRRLRYEFVEAAAKYDEYETFIERNETSEDWYCNNGRYSTIGRIRWPYGSYRKCWILAPFSGENEEPFSVMKTLFGKAWLWLPRDIANNAIDTAELHLSDPLLTTEDRALWWAKSDYQHWCWLLWFHWQRQLRLEHPTEAAKPPQKMVLSPFHCSADLIAQWGLDGSDGKIPEWLSPPTPGTEPQPPFTQRDDSTNTTKDPTEAKGCTVFGDGQEKLIEAPTQHDNCADASCPNQEPVGNNEPARSAESASSLEVDVSIGDVPNAKDDRRVDSKLGSLARDVNTPAPVPPVPLPPAGYLGGRELAVAFGIPEANRKAFLKRLERLRRESNCWKEISNPTPNSPRYLFQASSPLVMAIVEKYRNSKAI